MKIYFDGCSWCWGAELQDRYNERYSKLICDKLGAEETNHGIPGGSNDRIVRNLLVEYNIEEYDYVIIQMTFPPRTEYYDPKKNKVNWEHPENISQWVRVNAKHNYDKWLYDHKKGNIKRLAEKFENHNEFWKYYFLNVANQKLFDTKEKIHYETIRNYCEGDAPIIADVKSLSSISIHLFIAIKTSPLSDGVMSSYLSSNSIFKKCQS